MPTSNSLGDKEIIGAIYDSKTEKWIEVGKWDWKDE